MVAAADITIVDSMYVMCILPPAHY